MKKIFKAMACTAMGAIIAMGAVGCGGDSGNDNPSGGTEGGTKHNTETRSLQLAIGSVDQKFNPLFYTAQNDGIIAGMTQASLMTVNSAGQLAYGQDYPTATLAYLETYYDKNGNAIGWGDGTETKGSSSNEGSTTFEFVIKNGMKFSDGEDLTVMDVLFNLYVYLDPAYSGSSTIYSTKIMGMQAYRKQDPSASDDDLGSDSDEYTAAADTRFANIVDWSKGELEQADFTPDEWKVLQSDYAKALEMFAEELETDWNSLEKTWYDNYKDNYRFTAAWQAYYFVEGVIHTQTEIGQNGNRVELKDGDGKYLTSLDPEKGVAGGAVEHAELIAEIEEAASADKVAAFMASHAGYTAEDATLALQKEFAVDKVYQAYANRSGAKKILTEWATGVNLYDYIISDERTQALGSGDGVANVRGVTVYRTDKLENKYAGTSSAFDDGKEHDVLKITVKGVDPKAKWNFSFAVAPMHYYSDKEHIDAAKAAYALGSADGGVYSSTCRDFGVEFNNRDWLDKVVATGAKSKLPVGAGPYKATRWDHDSSKPLDGTTFFYNNIAYYERNTYFSTLGTGLENAKIKYVNYKVLSDDKIITALSTGEIDYGEPIAKADNALEIAKYAQLDTIDYFTGGYGYVGINPAFVPDIEVRKAIMHSFDTSAIMEYYGEDYVNPINRPVSTTSWAYPEKSTRYYERITDVAAIRALVEESGNWKYDEGTGKLRATDSNTLVSKGTTLSLTFTIAGESSDHPAFNMFKYAEVFLEECGFEIAVVTDVDALKKLATGKLSVWAAAWSSSIDPDPYQIYSKYSEASSTKNWYKEGILANAGGKFDEELEIVNLLADYIEDGRSTLNQQERIRIYKNCYELIMDLAVEFPTYQRKDMCVYNKTVLNSATFTEASYIAGPLNDLWKVNYV